MFSDTGIDAQFIPNGIITLLTDFGLSEPYVGIMKGVILARSPSVRLIDLTHQVPMYQPTLAGFWLSRCWQYFPRGTMHLAVVDPGVGTERGMVVLEAGGQVFIAPDNGLLSSVFHSATDARWRSMSIADLTHLLPSNISPTFHGRDIFAPLVAEIAGGRQVPDTLGVPKEPPIKGAVAKLGEGHVIGSDHFGNVITDIDRECLKFFNNPRVAFRDQCIPLYKSYGFAPAGSLLALVNSWNTVEIAIAQGSAQQFLQATLGEPVRVVESGAAPV